MPVPLLKSRSIHLKSEMKRQFAWKAVERDFKLGEQVLVLLPICSFFWPIYHGRKTKRNELCNSNT